MSNKNQKKFKYWAAVSYPGDSEPADVFARAKEKGVECCCIIHDKDYNETPDEPKKVHRHWLFAFPNTTTLNNANTIIQYITNGPEVQGISNIKGAYAYLTHKHDPDKAQYEESDIQSFNGFSPNNYFSMNNGEENEAFVCIEKIIREQDFEEYCVLLDYLEDNFPDLARFMRTHTIHIKAYLQSKNFYKRQKKRDKLLDLQLEEYALRVAERKQRLATDFDIDPETGEVLNQSNEVKE